jgi:ATP-dependent Clp protease ATP-binding subunit ClpC
MLRRGVAFLVSAALVLSAPGPAAAQAVAGLSSAPLPSAPELPALQVSPDVPASVELAPSAELGLGLSPLPSASSLAPTAERAAAPLPKPNTARAPLNSLRARGPAPAAAAPAELQVSTGRRLFDLATSRDAAVAASEADIGSTLLAAPAPKEESRPEASAPRLFDVLPRLTRRAAAEAPRWAKPLAAGLAAAALTALLPHSVALPIAAVALTCNAMRERQIKDQTILPNQYDRQKAAQKELDEILIRFGKRLKKEADADARVQSRVNAHAAEHGAENPLLDLLPQWRERWAKGEALTKEQALAELRGSILKELKRTTLRAEDEALIEELFNRTGGWDELLAWETKYGVLDALKADAESKKQGGGGSSQSSGEQGGDSGTGFGTGTLMIGAILLGHAILQATGHHAYGMLAAAAFPILLGVQETGSQKPAPPVAIEAFLKGAGLNDEEATFLKGFTTDLGTKDMAPVIGRTEEIQRVITILSKPSGMQNNPMLLGDKGVGKTAIVEAVAKYLYENRLPALKGKRILELDVGRLAAGTSLQGELEKRLTQLREIVAKTDNKVVLFVDEIHTLLKNRTTSNSVPDLLKSPLRDGKITVIGGTTLGEYRKYVDEDPAFADRFEPVKVDEPKIEQAIEMLEGSQEFLERKFEVKIEPDVLEAAVRLSARYMPEKFLPRKARLLMESAIAEAKPQAARDGLQVRIDQASDRLRLLIKRYAQAAAAAEAGAKEGDEAMRLRAAVVQAHNRVVALYQTILSLEAKQRSIEARPITKEDVIRTLARDTGIPIGDLGQDEYQKLMNMEPWFQERVVGQDDAVKAVASTVRRNKSGLGDPNRPQGVFMFAGSTGVGKTEIARRLAEFLFGDKNAMVRLDMSEYMEKFSVQRLFGAPPGYVGYDQGGELTEKIRRRPYTVLLLDEIEKAHPDVLNALLQVFEDGRMTDGKGNTVDFKNVIIVMTSNIGAGGEQSKVLEAIKARLRPEFVNRVDQIVVFNKLNESQAADIVRIRGKEVRDRLSEQDLDLDLTDEAVEWLAKNGFDPDFGARPLKRAVEKEVADALSPLVLEWKATGRLVNGGKVRVAVADNKLTFALSPNPPPSVEMTPLPEGAFGAKLRRIMEQAVKDAGATDPKAFEKLLFPDRGDVTLEPMGAYRLVAPNQPTWAEPSLKLPLKAAADLKEPGLAEERKFLDDRMKGRIGDPAAEALDAWLEAFSAQAKSMPGLIGSPMLKTFLPSKDDAGEMILRFDLQAGADAAALQKWARSARDHFQYELPDEAGVRRRAGELRDEGKQPDLALLEAKRLIEQVPGAEFGHTVSGNWWVFWLRLPVGAKPAPPPPPPPPPKVEEPKPEPAPAPAEAKPAPKPAAPPLETYTPLEARSSMSKMFLYLTQKAQGGSFEPVRKLVAELLASPSASVNLIGLHAARELLTTEGFGEVAALGRYLRVSDAREHVLFGELASIEREAGRSLPMPTQREAVKETHRLALGKAAREARSNDRYLERTQPLYARNAAAAEGQASDAESKALLASTGRPSTRARRILAAFAAGQLLAAGGFFAAWRLTGDLPWFIVGTALSAIILWWVYGGVFGKTLRNARWGRFDLEAQLVERMKGNERTAVSLRWLRLASRGESLRLDDAELARLLKLLWYSMPATRAQPILREWRAKAQKALEGRPESRAARRAFASLQTLGHFAGWLPASEHKAFTNLMLLPLEKDSFPDEVPPYAEGLAAWLGSAQISPQDLERAFLLMTQGKAVTGLQRSSYSGLAPAIEALAGRSDLAPSLREAIRQHLTAAMSESNGFQRDRVPFALAKLGFGQQAWDAMRKRYDGNPFNLTEAYQLALLAPPDASAEARLLQDITPKEKGAPSGIDVYGPLLSSLLKPEPDQDVSRSLTALQKFDVAPGIADPYRQVLVRFRAALSAAAKRSDTERPGALKASVDEGMRRLQASDR